MTFTFSNKKIKILRLTGNLLRITRKTKNFISFLSFSGNSRRMFRQQHFNKVKTLFGIFIVAFIITYTRYLSQNIFQKIKPYNVVANVDEDKFRTVNNTKEFVSQWCRILREKTDWKSILASCAATLTWESRKALKSSLETDTRNAFVASQDIRPAGKFRESC